MMNFKCPSALLALVLLAACADHSGSSARVIANSNPKPPINGGDGDTFATQPAPPPGNSHVEASTAQSQNCGGGGGGGGNPAPEPGTILLVGTGLAGAALYSRNRKKLGVTTEPRS